MLPLIRMKVLLAGSKLDHLIGVLFLPKEVAQVTHSFDLTDEDLHMLCEWGFDGVRNHQEGEPGGAKPAGCAGTS